jgi:hypothetical protein
MLMIMMVDYEADDGWYGMENGNGSGSIVVNDGMDGWWQMEMADAIFCFCFCDAMVMVGRCWLLDGWSWRCGWRTGT